MDDFIRKVENYIIEQKMLAGGETVVLGVSGGADSVSLLLVMCALADKYSLALKVVHVNHGLREEASQEADYVKRLCEERKLSFFLQEYDVAALAKENGLGTEEMGRNLRYALFESTLGRDSGVIAVAHNMNDRAETMLFNLARGTGAKGLGSIPAVRGNIIRPLLCVTREEIEDFLHRQKIEFCTDCSNFADDYTRNRIRNNVLPVMRSQISEDVVEHMSETADQLQELNSFAEGYATNSLNQAMRSQTCDCVIISRAIFNDQNIYIRKVMVKKIIDLLVPHNRDITHTHLESVVGIAGQTGNHRVNLPYGMIFEASYDNLVATLGAGAGTQDTFFCTELKPDEAIDLGPVGRFSCRLVKKDKSYTISSKQFTKCFDYDKVKKVPVIRTRQAGDTIVINSEGSSKKLSRYFIDEKIPETRRDTIPLLADGDDIMWVVGYRISGAYKVTEQTENILEITYYREED